MKKLTSRPPEQAGTYTGEGRKTDDAQRWYWTKYKWINYTCAITLNELKLLYPSATILLLRTIETTINLEGVNYGIDSLEKLAGFISQTAFETARFTRLEENLNYSLPRLKAVFSKKRLHNLPDKDLAVIIKDNRKLAQLLYGGQGTLDYRGRGLIHTTLIENYKALSVVYNRIYGSAYKFELYPQLLATNLKIAVRSGLLYFKKHKLFSPTIYVNTDSSKAINRWDVGSFVTRNNYYLKVLKQLNNASPQN